MTSPLDILKMKMQVPKSAKPAKAKPAERPEPSVIPEWHSRALVFRMEQWVCACGAVGTTPLGLFIVQTHSTHSRSTRFLAAETRGLGTDGNALPRARLVDEKDVPICSRCAADSGFASDWQPPKLGDGNGN